MPKSRRSKRRYQAGAKKREIGQAPSAVTAQPSRPLAASSSVSTSTQRASAATPAPRASAAPMQYPYVTGDLVRTGIIAGVMVLVLVVLAVVLR